MKDTIITEFVKFKVLQTTTDDQLMSKADIFNDFQKNQDGFINAELVKDKEENAWFFIFHYESMEKVKAIGEKLSSCKEFDELKTLFVPGSIGVTFYPQLRKWYKF
jgi:hypothetical protein